MEQTLSAPFLDRERDMYASCAKPCALNLEKE